MGVRNVEAVFVIDGTGTMHTMIDGIKEKAMAFADSFRSKMEREGVELGDIRAKVIVFRDYKYDPFPMDCSDWYDLPIDDDLFGDRLKGIIPKGGGDKPENGLEALWQAFNTDYSGSSNDFRLIFFISDADALPLGARKGTPKYPEDMGNLDDFIAKWMTMSNGGDGGPRSSMIWLFAPSGTFYEELVGVLPKSLFQPITPESTSFPFDFSDIKTFLSD